MSRLLGPLPENAFVAAARDTIPAARERVTTTSTRGNLRGRGRGRSNASRGRSNAAGRGSTSKRGKGKKRGATKANLDGTTGPTSGTQRMIPDLNQEVTNFNVEEVPVSQNAPNHDNFWF
jgi:hypothetical protein